LVWKSNPATYPVKAASLRSIAGWEVEGGGRYFGSWSQFHRDTGQFTSSSFPSLQATSRLTYDNMQTNSGEFFGRIETPWNLFVKGYIGGGATNIGHLNDEDFVVPIGSLLGAYSNTLSVVTGTIGYGAIDGGFDLLRTAESKVGAFAGYFALNQRMDAFGCRAIAFVNCTPFPVPTSGAPVITEDVKWRAVRIGMAGETMLTDRLKISGEAAYLPWVQFNGVDDHFVGNTGALATVVPQSGNGRGAQFETLLSYYVTPQWSVGVGGRYWGMWTTSGERHCGVGIILGPGLCPALPTPPQFHRAQVEQVGAFVQTSYKFDWSGPLAALD
jgi:hypothetical protein